MNFLAAPGVSKTLNLKDTDLSSIITEKIKKRAKVLSNKLTRKKILKNLVEEFSRLSKEKYQDVSEGNSTLLHTISLINSNMLTFCF